MVVLWDLLIVDCRFLVLLFNRSMDIYDWSIKESRTRIDQSSIEQAPIYRPPVDDKGFL